MSDRVFFDTNIFVYAASPASSDKAAIARNMIEAAMEHRNGAISYQVVQEFVNVAVSKFRDLIPADRVPKYLQSVFRRFHVVHSSLTLFGEAIDLHARHKLSWYDSLIVAAAAESKCSVLYTEDLQHGATIAGVRITDPFLIPKPK